LNCVVILEFIRCAAQLDEDQKAEVGLLHSRLTQQEARVRQIEAKSQHVVVVPSAIVKVGEAHKRHTCEHRNSSPPRVVELSEQERVRHLEAELKAARAKLAAVELENVGLAAKVQIEAALREAVNAARDAAAAAELSARAAVEAAQSTPEEKATPTLGKRRQVDQGNLRSVCTIAP